MLRPLPIGFVLSFALSWGNTASTLAQDFGPGSRLDLVRGLREDGQTDLALEYLKKLKTQANPGLAKELPLEEAKIYLVLSETEEEESTRDSYLVQAKDSFGEFLRGSPNHPRAPEANLALARLVSIEAKSTLSKARRIKDEAAQRVEAANARRLYEASTKQFTTANKSLDDYVQKLPNGQLKNLLARDVFQAKLELGINQYMIGESYLNPQRNEVDARYNSFKKAREIFSQLSTIDEKQPACWVAKAWIAETNLAMSERGLATDIFTRFPIEARRNPAARAGLRMSRFFELRDQWLQASSELSLSALRRVRTLCRNWRTEFQDFRPTGENTAVAFYEATTKFDEAQVILGAAKVDPKNYPKGIPSQAMQMLRDSEKDFRKLIESDHDYTERASKERNKVIRIIIGNAEKPATSYTSFDECHMAALVQYDKLVNLERAEQPAYAKKVIALFEHELALPVPKESQRQAEMAQLLLIYVYRLAGNPFHAAILGEHMARTTKNQATVAKAGFNAMIAYLEAAEKNDPVDFLGKKVDYRRAMALTSFLEDTIPTDPVIDEVRYRRAQLLTQENKYYDAALTASRISNSYPRLSQARLLEGGLAYELIRPLRPNDPSLSKRQNITPQQQNSLFRAVSSDLAGLTTPEADASANDVIGYTKVQIQLAQLYLATGLTGCPEAEKIATAAKTKIKTFNSLNEEQKELLTILAETVRIDAVFGQAAPMLEAGKFKEAADRLAPFITEVVNSGVAVKENQPATLADAAKRLDAARLDRIVVPALNARVREGAIDKASELLDLLKKLGGNLDRAVEAVASVTELAQPQIAQLKRQGKVEEADNLRNSLTQIITKISTEPNLSPVVLYNLGKSLKELGDYTKALELLEQVQPPTDQQFLIKADVPRPEQMPGEADADFQKKLADWETNRTRATLYIFALLERIRASILSDQLDKAKVLLDESLGADQKTGWAVSRADYIKEHFRYLEAMGRAAGEKASEAGKYWSEARKGWDDLMQQYRRVLIRPEPKDETQAGALRRQKEYVRPLFFDAYAESARCRTEAILQVYKNDTKNLDRGLGLVAKQMYDMEKANEDFPEGAKAKLQLLLENHPELLPLYQSNDGKMFLPTPPMPMTPDQK